MCLIIQMFVNLDTFAPSKFLILLAPDSIFNFLLKQGSEIGSTLDNELLEMPTNVTVVWNSCYSRNIVNMVIMR